MKKIKLLSVFLVITALTLTACNSSGFSFKDEMGVLSSNANNMGLPSSIRSGYIYYQGSDGFYEYDPQDKTSVKVSEKSLGYNAVKGGFIIGEEGKLQYLNFKGEVISEQSFSECQGHSSIFAYDNRIYCLDFVFDTESGQSSRLFEERNTDMGFYYGLSEDYYFRADISSNTLEKISVKENDSVVQSAELPREITRISSFTVDLNSDIYISTPEGSSFKTYKIAANGGEAEPLDISPTLSLAVMNGSMAYIDADSNTLYYNNKPIAENVLRFSLLSENYVIYSIIDDSMEQAVYLYDAASGSTEKLKTVTEEEE